MNDNRLTVFFEIAALLRTRRIAKDVAMVDFPAI